MHGPSAEAEPRECQRSVRGGLTFWLIQISAWSLIHAVLFLPSHGLATRLGATTREVVLHTLLSNVQGIVISSLMGWLYVYLPERYLRGARAVVTILLVCFGGAGLWLLTSLAVHSGLGMGPWMPPELREVTSLPILVFARSTMMLGTWSALFLVAVLGQRVQIARERAVVAASAVHEAQLQLLRSQLNPHFLFNALNSIIGLITEEPKRARQMVRDLAALLRRALDGTRRRHTTVGDELEFIELYLRCEKVRFEERLQVDVDVPEALRSLPLPSMLLHPLVENAVKHGMRGDGPLKLAIVGRLEGDRLVLEVANTGALGNPRRTPQPGTGTGLRNVRERVRSLYPDDGDVDLSDGEGWVRARIQYTPPAHGAAA